MPEDRDGYFELDLVKATPLTKVVLKTGSREQRWTVTIDVC